MQSTIQVLLEATLNIISAIKSYSFINTEIPLVNNSHFTSRYHNNLPQGIQNALSYHVTSHIHGQRTNTYFCTLISMWMSITWCNILCPLYCGIPYSLNLDPPHMFPYILDTTPSHFASMILYHTAPTVTSPQFLCCPPGSTYPGSWWNPLLDHHLSSIQHSAALHTNGLTIMPTLSFQVSIVDRLWWLLI